MPATWNTETEHRLLVFCIDSASKPHWETVAKNMGGEFSAEACRQRFGKIRKGALENSIIVASSTTSPSPAKRNRAKKEEGDGTPTKKTKKNAKAAENPNKKEEDVKEAAVGTNDNEVAEQKPNSNEIDTV